MPQRAHMWGHTGAASCGGTAGLWHPLLLPTLARRARAVAPSLPAPGLRFGLVTPGSCPGGVEAFSGPLLVGVKGIRVLDPRRRWGVPPLWAMLLTGCVEASFPLLACSVCRAGKNAGSAPPAAALHTCHRPGPHFAAQAALRSSWRACSSLPAGCWRCGAGAGSVAEQDQGQGATSERRTGAWGCQGAAPVLWRPRGGDPCSGRGVRPERAACHTLAWWPQHLRASCFCIFIDSASCRNWMGGPWSS